MKELLVTVGLAVAFLAGVLLGDYASRGIERDYAVKAGVGRYEADPKTGTTHFYYLSPAKP